MNFYDILGVDREADRSEIRAAYRSLARRYHPDVNDHPDASDQFKVLSRARDVLTDETERSAYDRLGHADYVAKRLEGPLPDVEMDPQPGDDADVEDADEGATEGAARDDAGSRDSGGVGDDTDSATTGGSTAGADSSAGDASTGRDHAGDRAGAGTGGGIGAGSAGPASNDGPSTGGSSQESADATRSGDAHRDGADTTARGDANRGTADSSASASSNRETTDTSASASSNRETTDATTTGSSDRESAGTGASSGTRRTGDAATRGASTGGTAGDDGGPSTGTVGAEQAAEREKSYSTPPTPGGPSGPERLRNDQTRTSRRLGSPLATVRAHFGASHRWLVVVAAAGVYGAGLAGYLLATAGTLGTLWNDLTSGDLAAMTGAIAGTNYEVPGLLEYGLGPAGGVQPLGTLSVLGAVVLPVALAIAVYGLRRHATWRPSWLHVLGALGPLASVGLTYIDGAPKLPVLVDLLLIVVFPAAVVASFLLNRLVLVAPLRRREDLGLP